MQKELNDALAQFKSQEDAELEQLSKEISQEINTMEEAMHKVQVDNKALKELTALLKTEFSDE